MSSSSKFDLSAGSLDRPLYASAHRGSCSAVSLDRSSSFRESMENPLLSSLPNMTRSSSSVTQGDVLNFFQCVRFDPKSMLVEHKLNRPAVFKRLASASVGIPVEDSLPASSKSKQLSSPSLEDLRRLKSGLRESGTKARERVKIFNDCLSVINKCFPTNPSRKRSKLDALSNDQSNTLLSIDRPASGMGSGKMAQNHTSSSSCDLEQQKSEERIKSTIPNKRTRTSLLDSRAELRANNLGMTAGTMDKDRDIVRFSNGSAAQGEDRTLSIAVDGWENSKTKRKRTGTKSDVVVCSMMTKPVEGCREAKQGMEPRICTEVRSNLSNAHGFRSGITNGGVGVGRSEATLQTSSGMRSSLSRSESDNSSLLHERRDRQEKEKMNMKAAKKANSREDFSSGSPTSGSKLNANVRAPRSGATGGVSKLSQVVPRPTPSNDWELSNCTSKVLDVHGANNRKRTPSRSSSPVANWSQRPQKISRTARTNLLPIIPGNEESPVIGTASEMMVNERRFPAYSPQQVKLKSDSFSAAALSESEESGAAEIKSRDKNKKCGELDEKSGQNVQKMSILLLAPTKNKAVSKDNHGDGVRRQGRTSRGVTSSRSLLPSKMEKLGNVGTPKQIRSSRVGLDKNESRGGRPPTRKLSDRKAYARQKRITINTGADFLVGSDNGHEELLAAANAVTNTVEALSSPFWKKMDPIFRFISDLDISYLIDQVSLGSAVNTLAPVPLDTGSSTLVPNGCRLNEFEREEIEMRNVEHSPEHLAPGANTLNEISLFQRLLAALIPEEGNQVLFYSGKEDLKYDEYGLQFEIENNMESDTFCSQMSQSCDPSGYPTSNGYGVNCYGRSLYELEHNIVSLADSGFIPSYNHMQNGSDQLMPDTVCSEYHKMSFNERLLTEVHSIGIFPDLVSDLALSGYEEINGDINRLEGNYREQVSTTKSLLGKIPSAASEAKEIQEKEFEERALDKLVGMVFEKYMSCLGPYAHGMKGATGKMAKQASLAFLKRVLERYREFEMTGKSCFDEPLYRDIFVSGLSRVIDGQTLNSSTDDESGKLHPGTSGCSIEARTSAPIGTQQSPSPNIHETYSSEALPSTYLDSEQNRVKRRELLLHDVGGTVSSAKGKRSERDREGKGNTKIGRPSSASVKGERKSKAKTKQKTVNNLTAAFNGPLGKMSDQSKGRFSSSKSNEFIRGSENKNDDMDILEDPIDLSGLQLPGMEDLGVSGGQGEDLESWLNIEDEGFDHDFMGSLDIPMDDLSDLNMLV